MVVGADLGEGPPAVARSRCGGGGGDSGELASVGAAGEPLASGGATPGGLFGAVASPQALADGEFRLRLERTNAENQFTFDQFRVESSLESGSMLEVLDHLASTRAGQTSFLVGHYRRLLATAFCEFPVVPASSAACGDGPSLGGGGCLHASAAPSQSSSGGPSGVSARGPPAASSGGLFGAAVALVSFAGSVPPPSSSGLLGHTAAAGLPGPPASASGGLFGAAAAQVISDGLRHLGTTGAVGPTASSVATLVGQNTLASGEASQGNIVGPENEVQESHGGSGMGRAHSGSVGKRARDE